MTAKAIMVLARRTRYLEAEMLGLKELVGPGSVCVDVGAAAAAVREPPRRERNGTLHSG